MAGRVRRAYRGTRKAAKVTAKVARKTHRRAKKVHGVARKGSKAVSRTVKQGKTDFGKIFRQAGFR